MRGFLNEIKNVAINRATNKLNNVISDALGGGRTTNPGARGGVDRSQYATLKPFKGKHISYPEDLGSNEQGHYIVFHINEQAHANVKFSQGRNLKKPSKMIYGLIPKKSEKIKNKFFNKIFIVFKILHDHYFLFRYIGRSKIN